MKSWVRFLSLNIECTAQQNSFRTCHISTQLFLPAFGSFLVSMCVRVCPCVCGADALSAAQGTPDVWKKCAGVKRQLPTYRERQNVWKAIKTKAGRKERGREEGEGWKCICIQTFSLVHVRRAWESFSLSWDPPSPPKHKHAWISQNVKCFSFKSPSTSSICASWMFARL